MKCGHLFNGIGGFALAAHWMRWENVMHCEINPFCNWVMNYHFPISYQHEDIRTTDFSIWRGKLDLITGGFPCQPYSTAGQRKGKEDERHLWPEMLRAIREISPRWVVGENVRGLVNWNGGLVFDEVQANLEAEGYEVLPFLLPAAGVNAPHRRDRIWFVAYSTMLRCGRHISSGEAIQWTQQTCRETWPGNIKDGTVANSDSINGGKRARGENGTEIDNGCQLYATDATGIGGIQGQWQPEAGQFDKTDWEQFPTQSPLCSRNDGVPSRLDGITFSKWRRESIKAGGNAIVPQVAFQIFKAIQQYTKYDPQSPPPANDQTGRAGAREESS